VITSTDGRLNLLRALPETAPGTEAFEDSASEITAEARKRVWTAAELSELERANIERALENCGGKVSGEGGAAELLGMKSSTLSSRIKALGLKA
jgi:transcriptional regulator with GAF, ATPase, and Fis domain